MAAALETMEAIFAKPEQFIRDLDRVISLLDSLYEEPGGAAILAAERMRTDPEFLGVDVHKRYLAERWKAISLALNECLETAIP